MEPVAEPERTPSRRTLTLIMAPIIALIVVGTVGNAIHPALVNKHPLVLIAMEPRLRYLLLVAGRVDFLPFLLVATVRRLASDPLFYLLGALYGDAAVRWIERRMGEGGVVIRAAERWFGKAAPVMVFLFPGPLVCVLAGVTGMSLATFFVLNIAGTLTVILLTYQFADLVSTPVNAVNNFYAHHNKLLIAISVSATVLWLVMQQRSGRSSIQSIAAIEKELESDNTETDES